MKLAILTAYPPSKTTLNEYGYHLVKHFRQHPEVTEIVLLTDETYHPKLVDFSEEGCKVSVHECWKFNSFTNLPNIFRALRTTQPDALFINLQFMKFGDKKIPAALGLLVPVVSKALRIPTITLLHNILEQVDLDSAGFAKNKLLQRVFNLIGTALTRSILVSDVLAVTINKYVEVLEAKYKARNVTLVPHGAFETPPEPNYRLPKGPKQVMAFGKFGTYKKVEMLIEAVEKLRRRVYEDIEIVIAGTDSPNTPGYLAEVRERYRHVPQLRFTGYVAEADVPRLFNDSSVVVFPYTSTTGSSGVLHQAGSYGKAVVLPNIGDLGRLVSDEGYRGEFFEPDSVTSLANAIESVLTDDAYRVELGKTNYRAACALPMSQVTKMYLELFKGIRFATSKKFELKTMDREKDDKVVF